MKNKLPTPTEFQRVGLLSVLCAFANNDKVDVATQLSIKQATLKVLNEHPVQDGIENITKFKMR
tara:strand:+ start:65 stop:256 length:192 start_codon:yes stop_codon:yes gene_type:complete